MEAKVLLGKPVADRLIAAARNRVKDLKNHGIEPHLAVVYQGNEAANDIYMKNQVKKCEELGIKITQIKLAYNATEKSAIKKINELNENSDINGIIVQRPLSKLEFCEQNIINAISIEKDVEGVTEASIGRIAVLGKARMMPCTPRAVIDILMHYGINSSGKNVAVIGRSLTVGKPMGMMMMANDATVTQCHSKTSNLSKVLENQDIIISATGKKAILSQKTLSRSRKKPVIIDIGYGVDRTGKVYGDCAKTLYSKASAYTPVINGVGVVTVAELMVNITTAAWYQNKL